MDQATAPCDSRQGPKLGCRYSRIPALISPPISWHSWMPLLIREPLPKYLSLYGGEQTERDGSRCGGVRFAAGGLFG